MSAQSLEYARGMAGHGAAILVGLIIVGDYMVDFLRSDAWLRAQIWIEKRIRNLTPPSR